MELCWWLHIQFFFVHALILYLFGEFFLFQCSNVFFFSCGFFLGYIDKCTCGYGVLCGYVWHTIKWIILGIIAKLKWASNSENEWYICKLSDFRKKGEKIHFCLTMDLFVYQIGKLRKMNIKKKNKKLVFLIS